MKKISFLSLLTFLSFNVFAENLPTDWGMSINFPERVCNLPDIGQFGVGVGDSPESANFQLVGYTNLNIYKYSNSFKLNIPSTIKMDDGKSYPRSEKIWFYYAGELSDKLCWNIRGQIGGTDYFNMNTNIERPDYKLVAY